MESLTIPKPFDAHVHFRDNEILQVVAPMTAQHFSLALVMPNLVPPVVSDDDIRAYRERIQHATQGVPDFEPLMTFKILPGQGFMDVRRAHSAKAVAGKVYPKGLTTHAEDGVEDYFALHEVFSEMQHCGMVLCLHGEKPGLAIEGLDRERAFLRTLFYLARTYPNLRIVLEHITTEAAVEAVLQLPEAVAATITVHHLLLTIDDVAIDRMRPHHYCKPVAKFAHDRAALIEAATSGCPKFFFGSDSAPHARGKKECAECCAGIFTAPVALPLLAEIFESHSALDRLRHFVSGAGRTFYGRPAEMSARLRLVKKPMRVPAEIGVDPDRISDFEHVFRGGIVPFYADQEISWSVETA